MITISQDTQNQKEKTTKENKEEKEEKTSVINTTDVMVSEKLFSLQNSEYQRKLMLENLDSFLESYEKNRLIPVSHSIPPALTFSPNLGQQQSQSSEEDDRHIFVSEPLSLQRPENIEDIAFYTIPQLAFLIKNKHISCVELTTMYIERLKKYNKHLECVITMTDDLALKKAKELDEEIQTGKYRGILHGIPFGVKDLLSYPGYKTTWGAKPFENQELDVKATVIEKLENAGGIMVAKLSLGALAWGDVWFGGKTKSPWNLEQGSSGSSAGSASATAAGLVGFSIGSETWGSIVSPCTACGVTGLRPTFGRVSRHGAMPLAWTMDKLGPITRSVEDAAIVFNSIHGTDPQDPYSYSPHFSWNSKDSIVNKTIGYIKSEFEVEDEEDNPFKEQDQAALEKLKELGFKVVPVELPDIDASSLSFILSAEASTVFDSLVVSDKDKLLVRQSKDAWPNVFRSARFISAVEYIKANRIRTLLMGEMNLLFQHNNIDVLVAPSFSKMLLITNLTGHPCVVVPTGFRPDDGNGKGLPSTITFIGDLYKDKEALLLARKFQDSTNFHFQYPPMELND